MTALSSLFQAATYRGYYNRDEIRAYVPKPRTSPNRAKGQFERSPFAYIAADDEYQCPAGQRLTYRFSRTEFDKEIRRYWTSACAR